MASLVERAPGAVQRPGRGELTVATGVKTGKESNAPKPVFLLHPDGTLAEGIPEGHKESTPPTTPRLEGLAFNGADLSAEFEQVFVRHERLFLSLLLMEFATEVSFNVMYCYYAEYSVREVSLVYHSLTLHGLWVIFWTLFALEVCYMMVYYGVGALAIWKGRPKLYHGFAVVALAGILGQVLLAYMNKFNLLIFFLRLMAYVYAKFLRNLLQSMLLLPETGV